MSTPLSRRSFLIGAATSAAALLEACTRGGAHGPRSTVPASVRSPSGVDAERRKVLSEIPREVINRVYNGHMPGRGGDIILVPDGMNYVDGGISHSTSWPYVQDITMLWHGPGHIRAGQRVLRPVQSVDVAPTLAKLVGFNDFHAPDGEPMDEIFVPGAPPPKLVVMFVWDAGGRYVLNLHPTKWPNLRALIPKGTWYENATAGSGPSNTAPIHGNFGTGGYPRRHGILDNLVRFSDGVIGDPWERGPQEFLLETFADHYGGFAQSRAQIGLIAGLAWHLGMLGHGSQIQGNPRPIAILRQSSFDTGAEGGGWGLPEVHRPYYRVPDYVNSLPPASAYFDAAQKIDGKDDGKWRGHTLKELGGPFDTPARPPFMRRLIEEVIKREGFGRHELPDLLFLNSKFIDVIGHEFSASSLEEGDSIRAEDQSLPLLIDILDRQVGSGNWVLLLTADHGHSAALDVSGASPIKVNAYDAALERVFDRPALESPVVRRTRPGWTFLNEQSLRQQGFDQIQVADFVRTLTRADVQVDQSIVPPAKRGEPAFASAFPASMLESLIGR